ncbi:MAG: enoyl-CoA hydratase-related protein, partial [Alphaproteobacteria bacterium]
MKEAGGDAVTVDVASPIAIITINNPPVNALSQAVRHGLDQAMQKIAADDAITAAVIIGQGRVFIAGADIREFGKPAVAP